MVTFIQHKRYSQFLRLIIVLLNEWNVELTQSLESTGVGKTHDLRVNKIINKTEKTNKMGKQSGGWEKHRNTMCLHRKPDGEWLQPLLDMS